MKTSKFRLSHIYHWFLWYFAVVQICVAGFVDVTEESGVRYVQQEEVDNLGEAHLQSGGAVAGDFDGDGWTDLFVTRMQLPDILFRNLGPDENGIVRFEDVSVFAGFTETTNSNGVVAADIDNDGDLDLYLSTLYERSFLLYLNNGEGVFEKDTGFRGANLMSDTQHLGFSVSAGDYDRDGWIDLHTNEWNIAMDAETVDQHSVLLRNFGKALPGRFENATSKAGVELMGSFNNPTRPRQFAFSSSFADMDGDGWQDLVVAADFASSQIFWNNGDGTFEDGTQTAGVGLDQNGMGLTIGDFDGDGFQDFFVTSISDHKLYRNLGDRRFEEVSAERIEDLSGWGWGSSFFDYDNDGDLDLAMTTGYEDLNDQSSTVRSVSKSRLWENNDGDFSDVGELYGVTDEGPGKGLLVFDYDRDGRQDIFIVNAQSEPILYRNEIDLENDWLQVELRGIVSNRDGLGARVRVQANGEESPRLVEITGGSNYLSQNEKVAHFGLGKLEGDIVDSISIEWPSGHVQEIRNLAKNRRHRFVEPVDYDQWSESVFSSEIVDMELSGPDKDADGDGRLNFDEFAFGSNPMKANLNTNIGLPDVTENLIQDDFSLELRVSSHALGVGYVFEVSDDFISWTSAAFQLGQGDAVASEVDGAGVLSMIGSWSLEEGRFVRIRAFELSENR